MDVRTLKLKNEREGKFYENSYGEKFLVLEYLDYYNVKVRFENGYERIICWQQIEFKNKDKYSGNIDRVECLLYVDDTIYNEWIEWYEYFNE